MKSDLEIGGLPWYVWGAGIVLLPLVGMVALAARSFRRNHFIDGGKAGPAGDSEVEKAGTRFIDLAKLKAEGPSYPHPVIDPVLCIGCHACVDACPHDVLAIVNGVSTPIALDQCMEDTGCTVECPTSPKACIVLNGTKTIPPRKVPARNQRLMTNVQDLLVGDVSGVPLIKNALNEGAQVIDTLVEDLRSQSPNSKAEYDVAIIGIGPAGLSATAIAKQRGLKYIAVEQDKVVSTIQNYPAGKYVFFKPDTVQPVECR
jgi:NAD-dependent dihydropyrimidine dehydrogenase PreA subunit